MTMEELLEKGASWVDEGKDFEQIQAEVNRLNLDQESRKALLQRVDELIFHRALARQEKGKAIGQLLMGAVLMIFPLLVAYITYIPESRIIYLWYGLALLGAWNLKEGYKKIKTPFQAPENFGYSRKRFNRF